jgi:hypothetical protein
MTASKPGGMLTRCILALRKQQGSWRAPSNLEDFAQGFSRRANLSRRATAVYRLA